MNFPQGFAGQARAPHFSATFNKVRRWSAMAVLSVLGLSGMTQAAMVRTNGYDLFVNGSRFVIKGMNYSPVPIGVLPGDAPYYGDYFVPAFANVWKPDIAGMRAAGVNAIKLYAGNPALNAGAPGSGGNWKAFLDECYNGGVNPIYVVMFSYVQGGVIAAGGAGYTQYLIDYENMVKSTVNHPAILGYCVGNEIFEASVINNAQFWTNFGGLVDRVKAAGISQNAQAFTMTATNDETNWPPINLGEQSGKLTNLDAWGVNIYRGPQFGGAGNSAFIQYKQLMDSLNRRKPLIFGEWGTPHSTRGSSVYGQDGAGGPPIDLDQVPANVLAAPPYSTGGATTTSQFLTTQWMTIKSNIGAGVNQVSVGGFIFDWCDEYWKAGNASVQLGGPSQGFQGGAFAGGYWDEAWFGVTQALPASAYTSGSPIVRQYYLAYNAIKAFYTSVSNAGTELYGNPVFGAPNPLGRPDIDVEWPTRNNITTTEETVVLRGTASDDAGIDQILVRGPFERFELATGTTAWSSQQDLRIGANRFVIRAIDVTGDTDTETVTIIRIPKPRPIWPRPGRR